MANYCLSELQFQYFLPGKVQTDALEDRFGKYRSLAGSQYLISLRQLYEAESKLRLQNMLPFILKSRQYGDIDLTTVSLTLVLTGTNTEMMPDFQINITEHDFQEIDKVLPVLVYVSGYCARTALKKINCVSCKKLLVTDKTLDVHPSYCLIKNLDRGGLLFPHLEVVNIISCNYIVVQKLITTDNEKRFLECKNQRKVLCDLTMNCVNANELNLENCDKGHSSDLSVLYLIQASSNILLNNYCKKMNDVSKSGPKKRKINTVLST